MTTTTTRVPTVSTTSTGSVYGVAISRPEGRVSIAVGLSKATAEALAAEMRGALADAFHAGYGEGREWEGV